MRDYGGLFGGGSEDSNKEREEGSYEEEESDNPESFEEKQVSEFNKTWWLYDMVFIVADEDFTKMEQIWEMPYKGFLNHLSYKISKNNIKRN